MKTNLRSTDREGILFDPDSPRLTEEHMANMERLLTSSLIAGHIPPEFQPILFDSDSPPLFDHTTLGMTQEMCLCRLSTKL